MSRVLTIAREFIGVPWRYRGRDTNGVDCVGLVVLIARRLNIPFDDYLEYGRGQADVSLLQNFLRIGVKIPVSNSQLGDVLVFSERTQPGHCGIYSSQNDVIHCSVLRGKVLEEPSSRIPGDHIATFRLRHG